MSRFLFYVFMSLFVGSCMVSCSGDDDYDLASGVYDQDFSRWGQMGFDKWVIDSVFNTVKYDSFNLDHSLGLWTINWACYYQVWEHTLDEGTYMECRVIFIEMDLLYNLLKLNGEFSDDYDPILAAFFMSDKYKITTMYATPGGKLITNKQAIRKIQEAPSQMLFEYVRAHAPSNRTPWEGYSEWFQPYISQQLKDLCNGFCDRYGDKFLNWNITYLRYGDCSPGADDIDVVYEAMGGLPIRIQYNWLDDDMTVQYGSYYGLILESGEVVEYSISEMYDILCDLTGVRVFVFSTPEFCSDYDGQLESSISYVYENITNDPKFKFQIISPY